MLRNAVEVSDFPGKSITVQSYQRYEEMGGCEISRKKALHNTWIAPKD